MKRLFIVVLMVCPYVGASVCRLCVLRAFGGRTGFDVNIIHVFPQGVLASITLVEGVAGDGGAKARAKCEVGLPLCSVTVTAL